MMQRRSILGAGASLLAAGLVTPVAAVTSKIDFTDTLTMKRAYARMRGLAPDKVAMWWYSGTIYGQRHFEVQEPLIRMEGFSFNKVKVTEDGKLQQTISEAGYYSDLKTGEILTDWVNPLNGQKCKPRHYTLVQNILSDETSFKLTDSNLQPLDTRGKVGPANIIGDTVWIAEVFSNKYVVPKREGRDAMEDPGPFLVRSSLSTFSAKIPDLEGNEEFVPAQLAYQSYGGFVPWMRMGREVATMNTVLMGKKVKSPNEMPKSLRERYEADHPGWLADPKI
jgi:hypothetical protein